MISFVFDAMIVAAWAFIWTRLLTTPEHLFDFVRSTLHRLITKNSQVSLIGWRMKVYKVLIDCPGCHAGQIALIYQVVNLLKFGAFDLRFIILSIFAAETFTKWHTRTK